MSNDLKNHITKARADYKEGNYESAVENLNAAIDITPDNSEFYYLLGETLYKLKRYTDSINSLNKAVSLNSGKDKYYFSLGNSYYSAMKYEKALEAYNRAIGLNDNNRYINFNIGLIHYNNHDYDLAIKSFQKAIAFKPDRDNYYFFLANCYSRKAQYKSALKNYKKALDINPAECRYLIQSGIACYNNNEHDKAIQYFTKAIEIDSKNLSINYYIADILLDMNQYEEALKHLKLSISNYKTESDLKAVGKLLAETDFSYKTVQTLIEQSGDELHLEMVKFKSYSEVTTLLSNEKLLSIEQTGNIYPEIEDFILNAPDDFFNSESYKLKALQLLFGKYDNLSDQLQKKIDNLTIYLLQNSSFFKCREICFKFLETRSRNTYLYLLKQDYFERKIKSLKTDAKLQELFDRKIELIKSKLNSPDQYLKSLVPEGSIKDIKQKETERIIMTDALKEIIFIEHLINNTRLSVSIDYSHFFYSACDLIYNISNKVFFSKELKTKAAELIYKIYYLLTKTEREEAEKLFMYVLKFIPFTECHTQVYSYYRKYTVDSDLLKLHDLVDKAKEENSEHNRKQLIDQEKIIFMQELTEPEKHSKRAIFSGGMYPIPKDENTIFARVKANALTGLISYINICQKLGLKIVPEEYFFILQEILENTNDSDSYARLIKQRCISLIHFLYARMDDSMKSRAGDLIIKTIRDCKYDECIIAGLNFLSLVSNKDKEVIKKVEELYLKGIEENTDLSDKKINLIALGKVRSKAINSKIIDIINDSEAELSLKIVAVWYAGRIQTPENFNLLVSLLDSSDQILKELALLSMIEYRFNSRNNCTTLVKVVLKCVIYKYPDLSDIATSLLEIVEGKHLTRDYFINKECINDTDRRDYKKHRSKYIDGLSKLNVTQKNWLDISLLSFRNLIPEFIIAGGTFVITDSTVTAIREDLTGLRIGDGRFWDLVTACGNYLDKDPIISSKWSFKSNFGSFAVVAHEFNHGILNTIIAKDQNDFNKLKTLYATAKKEDRFLDTYAAWNYDEYFAQGYEAFVSFFKTHNNIIDNQYRAFSHNNTRSILKHRDPELYKFIVYLINKYKLIH